ncbi:hypothetical protein DV735_g955, partial [Chaetothyriales sp. CBS 134920]
MPNLGEESDLAGAPTAPALSASDKAGSPSADDVAVSAAASVPASALAPAKHSKLDEADPPKKKRKDRPCKRCIKRNIGHLCHDEPREGQHRKSVKNDLDRTAPEAPLPSSPGNDVATGPGPTDGPRPDLIQDNGIDIRPLSSHAPSVPALGSIQPQPAGGNGGGLPQFSYNSEPWTVPQNRFQDIRAFDPSFMFNANEVTDEYNLLGDFLSTSLLDEAGTFSAQDYNGSYNDPAYMNSMAVSFGGSNPGLLPAQMNMHNPLVGQVSSGLQMGAIPRPASVKPISDVAREKYYMTAADPAGNDPPEDRMNKLLKAKYDAGLLKPFNYVGGYARLNKYMEVHMKHSSRHKILIQLDQFRPKFRERMQSLTDIELVLVEMWFERNLMEYDRVFASMAIPACCWRRTGEIFRGNKEMAELIQVPIESLRDVCTEHMLPHDVTTTHSSQGKLAIHEIIVEDQLVSYWEKFCAICFDQQQKAMLTSCTLRNPNDSDGPDIHCCFSFTIKRDNHNIWKESRHDMADHFYDTLISEQLVTDDEQVAKAADLCYEIGGDHFRSAQYETAVRWLRRGLDLFDINDEALVIPGAEDIKFNLRHTLVRALLACDGSAASEEAGIVLTRLKEDYGSKLAVHLLQLEILSRNLEPDPDGYLAELTIIIRTVHLTESNHKIILHHSHQLKEASPTHATESTIVTYVWIACLEQSPPHSSMLPSDLHSDFDSFHASWNKSCSPEAADAILLLLWKQIDRKSNLHDSSNLRDWCILALHPLLSQAGPANIGKVQRRLVQCHMAASDYKSARLALDRMPPSVRQHKLSLFLRCSLALRSQDEIASDRALADIVKLGQADHQLLLASVAETMQHGTKKQAVLLLQRVLDKFNYDLPDDMDLCTMLRCTARLIISVFEGNPPTLGMITLELFAPSKSAADRPAPASFKKHLYRNTFTCYTALQQLLDDAAGASTANVYPQNLNDLHGKVTDLLPLVFEALIFISNAHAAEKGSFDEANLTEVVDKASRLEAGPKVYASFAHSLLSCFLDQELNDRAGIPLSYALHLLQKVIEAMTSRDDYDIDQAARWIRCVVQIVLEHRDGHEHLSLVQTTVDQALDLARSAAAEPNSKAVHQKAGPRQLYPAEELHWLSSALFNLGIDLYCKPDRQAAQLWMENAIKVAEMMTATVNRQDSGDASVSVSLAKTMRSRMAKLGL